MKSIGELTEELAKQTIMALEMLEHIQRGGSYNAFDYADRVQRIRVAVTEFQTRVWGERRTP